VTGSDPDTWGSLSYSLTDNSGGRFAINATTGVVTVANAALLDAALAPVDPITVRVTDQGGLTFDKAFSINVTPVGVVGTAANDTLTAASGGSRMFGLAGNDTLNGGAGNDVLDGGTGNDTLHGSAGNDTYAFNRGDGTDTVYDDYRYSQSYTYEAAVFDQVMAVNDFYAMPSNFNYVEIVNAWVGQDDSGNATEYGECIGYVPQTGTQVVHADGGSDTLSFGQGIAASDIEIQLSGNDLIVGVRDPANPNATFAQLTDKLTLQSWMDPLDRIETFRFADGTTLNLAGIVATIGTRGDDTISWSESAATLNGRAGNDVITGSAFNDTLNGGAGNDTLNGGAGTDTAVYSGNRASYIVTYNAATQTYTVADQRANQDGTDTVTGVESFQFANGTLAAASVADQAPGGATVAGGTVAENAANGTVVGTVTGSDPDGWATLGYSLTNNAGGRFAINATTGAITVANGTLLDYESATSHAITVRVTNQAGLIFDKALTITVTNVNEAPTNATLSNASVGEHSANGTVVGTVTGADPDAGATLSYSLLNDAGGRFLINATTGVLSVANGSLLDHATATTHPITVRVTDQGGLTYDKGFTVAVVAAPTLSSNAGTPTANNTVIPWFTSASPPDPSATMTYKVTGMPASATLPVGTKNPDGSWSVDAAQIPSLGVVGVTLPSGSFTGSATLTITATATIPGGAYVSSAAQVVVGDGGNDTLTAGSGTVVLIGGAGNDTITASSQDTVVFSGNRNNYAISYNAGTGTFTVSDQRAGTPDGTDTVIGTRTLQFADGTAVYDTAGRISTMTLYDRADVVSWNSFQSNYDTSGNVVSQHGMNEGGSSWTNVYDTSNASWSYYVDYFDGNGNLVSHTLMNDDQTSSLTGYNYDPNAAPWRSFTYNYRVVLDGDGNPVPWSNPSLTVVNYDGTTTLKTNEGQAISVYMSDLLNWYANPYVPTLSPPGGGGGDGLPVILDLDGDGIDIVPRNISSAQFDMDGGPTREQTAWVGKGDGLLAIDLGADGSFDGDGAIDQAKEIEFAAWAPGSTSDMAALRQVFDTNGNGWLDPGDAQWASFRVWQDANQDGLSQPGELKMLAQLGITGIDLTPTGPAQQLPDGSMIQGLSTFTRADGSTGTAGDVALAFTPSRASAANPTLSNGASIDASVAQLINALASHPAGDSGFDAPEISQASVIPNPVPIVAQALHA
jgi:hypothetical protein